MSSARRSAVVTACLAASLAAATASLPRAQQGAKCDSCDSLRIGVYDFEVAVPRPTAARDIIRWLRLFLPAKAASSYYNNEDPLHHCLVVLAGAMLNARATDGTLRFGHETLNLPPAGPLPALDYIVTGTVSQSGGANTAALRIEAAGSREQVTGGSAAFGIEEKGDDGPAQAGRQAAIQASPLLDAIRRWEKRKRDSDRNVAIASARNIVLEPEKPRISPGETVAVNLTLEDCDGVPLGGRVIAFEETTYHGAPMPGTTGGKVEPSRVTTDANGKARVRFTADAKTGDPMVVVAHWIHKRPSGHDSAWMGQAPLSPSAYLVDADWWEDIEGQYTNDLGGGASTRTRTRIRRDIRARFVWTPTSSDEGYAVHMTADADDGRVTAPSILGSAMTIMETETTGEGLYHHVLSDESGRTTSAAGMNLLFEVKAGQWSFDLGLPYKKHRTQRAVQCVQGTCGREDEAADEDEMMSIAAGDGFADARVTETKTGWRVTRDMTRTTPNPAGAGALVERVRLTANITRLKDR